jgi:CheY-like chemotaxis protein
MKQSGGHVKIYSELGVGTTVKLYIPRLLDKGAASPTQPATAGAPPSGKGQLVLVVEDDDDVRRLTVDILIELGYSILSANGPVQALSLLDKHPNIVLLMTDVVMPDMDGCELAQEALRRPDLKVLFTTGYTRNAIVHNGTLDDGVELIVKPFTLDGLAAKIAWVLGGKRAD